MILNERRRHFFINKPLQLHYMALLTVSVVIILFASLFSIYTGIWGEVLSAFSDEKIQHDLLTASRLQQYDEARHAQVSSTETFSTLSFFQQTERLSSRQQEIFKEILNHANRNLIVKLLFLMLFVASGTIFISHKIAGPLYRFEDILHRITQGELDTRCHLRKFDEAKSVAHAFNMALEFLDTRISRMKKIVRENEKAPDLLLPRLKEELSNFKTSADR